jgi:uncharacterized protein (TIGR02246 family)
MRPDPARDEAAVRELRAQFNAAIAAHDARRIGECWAADVHVSTSDGTPLVGREQVQRAFEHFFADPDFITFVREPERIDVAADGRTAAEHGRWTGHWRSAPRQSGVYLAAWHKHGRYWKLTSELYVPLG